MVGTCRCGLPAEQGELSAMAQVLGHQFSVPVGLANQDGARGDNAPTVGTNESADDSHRTYSPDHDGIHAMGLISGRRWRENCGRELDSGSGPHLLGVVTPCRFCCKAHLWVDCPTPHTLCYEPLDCQVPHWHPS
jgi:hypothetical protein